MTTLLSAGRMVGLAASLSLFGIAVGADDKVVLTPEDGKTAQLVAGWCLLDISITQKLTTLYQRS